MALRILRVSQNLGQVPLKLLFTCTRGIANESAKNIGFIGLGNMGSHMACNLMNKGHILHVHDISQIASDNIKAKGATVYKDVVELANKSDFVVTMLPNNDIVTNTYHQMVQDGVSKNTIFIDSSTIDPNVSKSIQKYVKSKGARFIDAPVSGGVPGAQAATLTFMVGGTTDEYNATKGVLECMGKRVVHCGDYGMGQAAKLCNNMMLGISMIGTSETMNLAIRLGLDPKIFMEILNSSTGRCWSSDTYNPVPGLISTAPANNNYDGGFSTALITKDLGLASGVATASNTPIPLGAMAHQIYRLLQSKGLGSKDFSIIYDYLKNDSNN